MTDFKYGSLRADLKAADAALALAEKSGNLHEQQKACAFALTAVQRSFPPGAEHPSLLRLLFALQRVIDGPGDALFHRARSSSARVRALPERQLDAFAVMFVRLFVDAGMTRPDAFARVASLFAGAGMTSHGGGRRTDDDHQGISRGVTTGSVKSLWNNSRPHGRLHAVGKLADETFDLVKAKGFATNTVGDVNKLFSEAVVGKPLSVVDLLTTPSSSETI